MPSSTSGFPWFLTLPSGGVAHFPKRIAKIVWRALRLLLGVCAADFARNLDSMKKVAGGALDMYTHNAEAVLVKVLDNVRTGTDGTMDPLMSIGAAAYEASLPDDLPTHALNKANEFVHHILVEHKQSGIYGTVMRHSKRLNLPTVPSIDLGFPNIVVIPTIYIPDSIAHMPVLLVRD
ncbi:hypothetical protein HOY80DRAFT_1140631 [Tuber brumale]|nr:hypothetical protein HOY80DRAFT_1140631 [Tuber brumale]